MTFGVDYLGAAAAVNVDVYTRDFRISGTVPTSRSITRPSVSTPMRARHAGRRRRGWPPTRSS